MPDPPLVCLTSLVDKFQLPAPAPTISFKAHLVTDTVAALIVAEEPAAVVNNESLLVVELPVAVNVPVTVWVVPAVRVSVSVAVAVPVLVKVVKVLEPETV